MNINTLNWYNYYLRNAIEPLEYNPMVERSHNMVLPTLTAQGSEQPHCEDALPLGLAS